MANRIKWIDWQSAEAEQLHPAPVAPNPRSAAVQLLGCLLGLAVLAAVLPAPASWGALLTDRTRVPGPVSIGATAETAVLVAAGVLVWILLGWVLVVWFAAIAGRLPGLPGRCGRSLLSRIAPAAAGRIIAAAVGVSLLAGTSACAVPTMTGLGSGSSAVDTTASTPAPLGGGAGVVDSPTGPPQPTPAATEANSPDEVITSITIDWPAAVEPAGTSAPVEPGVIDTGTVATGAAAPSTPSTDGGATAETTSATTATSADPGIDDADSGSPTTAARPPASTSHSDSSVALSTADIPAGEPAATGDRAPGETALPPAADSSGPAWNAPSTADQVGDHTTRSATNPITSGADGTSAAVLVVTGDTLWSIAHHHLTPEATDQEIDTAWRAWYSANQQVIGANPDLIRPGQLLLPPDTEMGR